VAEYQANFTWPMLPHQQGINLHNINLLWLLQRHLDFCVVVRWIFNNNYKNIWTKPKYQWQCSKRPVHLIHALVMLTKCFVRKISQLCQQDVWHCLFPVVDKSGTSYYHVAYCCDKVVEFLTRWPNFAIDRGYRGNYDLTSLSESEKTPFTDVNVKVALSPQTQCNILRPWVEVRPMMFNHWRHLGDPGSIIYRSGLVGFLEQLVASLLILLSTMWGPPWASGLEWLHVRHFWTQRFDVFHSMDKRPGKTLF
jgi:hypothetical protein